MHLLYLLNRFPKLSESFVLNEIHELEKRGHEVSIFSLRRPTTSLEHDEVSELEADVTYLPDPSAESSFNMLKHWKDPSFFSRHLRNGSVKRASGAAFIGTHLLRFIGSMDSPPDHLHAHFLDWPKHALKYVKSSQPELSITVTAHAQGLFSDLEPREIRMIAKDIDRIATISNYNSQFLKNIGISCPIDLVRMGIRTTKFVPVDQTVPGRLVTVARFVEKKGLLDAVAAIARIAPTYPDLQYHLIGSGPLENTLKNEIHKRGLEDTVILRGNVSDAELLEAVGEAQAFVLPCKIAKNGDRDGIPVALMEAMAMETAPISTTISGIPELITDGESGYLVQPEDIKNLALTIDTILSDPKQAKTMGKAARRTVETEYTVEGQVDALEAAFERCS